MARYDNFITDLNDSDLNSNFVSLMQTLVYRDKIQVYGFFDEIYRISDIQLRSFLLEQTGYSGSNNGNLNHITTWVKAKAAAATGGSDAEKWNSFKLSFPKEFQPTIQIIIDHEIVYTEPATSFSSFNSRSNNDMALAILSLDTDPEDFWTSYVKFFKLLLNRYADEWSVFASSISDDMYARVLILHNAQIQGDIVLDSDESISDFNVFKSLSATEIAKEYLAYNQDTFAPNFAFYLAYLIKENAQLILDGFYTEDQYEEAFYELFRPELKPGIRAFIQFLKDEDIITDFSDINDIPAYTTLRMISERDASVSQSQMDSVWLVFTGKDDNTPTGSAAGYSVSVGDTFVLELNGTSRVSYTAEVATAADVIAGLVAAISSAGGDWSDVVAADNTTHLTIEHNVDNTPFTLKSISIYNHINRYTNESYLDQLYLPANHPIYLSFAQAWLNDANAVDTAISVTKTFKGRAFIKDDVNNNIPASDLNITVSDIDDLDNIVVLGAVKTDSNGYFSINYTLRNSYVTEKSLRLSATDEEGNEVKITTSLEENLLVDAANGTFEGGTAPGYAEWNLTLGTDIEIHPSESLGEELQDNWDFSNSIGGLYIDYPQTTLLDFPDASLGYYFVPNLFPVSFYTDNILVVGKKYRIQSFFDLSPSFLYEVKDTDDNTIFSINTGDPLNATFEFTATTPALKLTINSMMLYDFSIKEVISNSNVYEGSFSPKFYLDASAPTDSYIFTTDASITIEENTDYEIEAWVYTHGSLMETVATEANSGIYLRPVSFSLGGLTQTNVYNGVNELLYETGNIRRITETGSGQWIRLYSRFFSGGTTSITLGLYLKGTLGDFNPNFGVMIDSISLKKDFSAIQDVELNLTVPSTISVFAKQSEPILDVAIAQTAGVSQVHALHIFPENFSEGDQIVLDLNHQSTVSYTVQEGDDKLDIVDGLFAAVTAETADLTIAVTTPSDDNDEQVTRITPADVQVGAKFKITKSGKNLFIDGDRGRFNSTSDVSGDPPSDWGLTKVSSILSELSTYDTAPYRGDYSLWVYLGTGSINGSELLFSTNNAIPVEKNQEYIIEGYFKIAIHDPALNNETEFYLLPGGYTRNSAIEVKSEMTRPTGGEYNKIYTRFNTGDRDSITFNFIIESKTELATTGGDFYLDELVFYKASDLATVLEYTASAATVTNVVTGLTAAITAETANTIITIEQEAALSEAHEIRVTPLDVLVGAKYVLQINNSDTIEYTAADDEVDDVTAGLEAAINAATSGEWTKITASDDTTHLTITANDNNVVFVVKQIGGHWSDVKAVNVSNNYIEVTHDDVDTPFVITQQGGKWADVTPTDNSSLLLIMGDANNVPFDIYTKIIKEESASIPVTQVLESFETILSADLTDGMNKKGINSIDDILAAGGLKSTLDGKLTISLSQAAGASQAQITHITPVEVQAGDIFILQIDDETQISYVAEEATIEDVVAGLIAAINAGSGDWTNVTASAGSEDGYVIITADSNNTPFSITHIKVSDSDEVKTLEKISSLYSVAAGLGFEDEKTLIIIRELIEAGYDSAMMISSVPKEEFIQTINRIAGDFNAARMYELAMVRKELTRKFVTDFAASQASYTISKSGIDGSTQSKIYTNLKESCACDDCETAVSPLAYLTDLSNYILKNIKQNETNITLETLEDTFYQNLIELPASCDDVRNHVCQIRIATEIMRRYVGSLNLVDTQHTALQSAVKDYVLNVYNYLLNAIGTSYDELRLIRSEADKSALALRLGINYTETPTFVDDLLFSPEEIEMADWDDYKISINGAVHGIINRLSTNLAALDPTVTFTTFKGLSPSALRTKLLLLPAASVAGSFMEGMGIMLHNVASEVVGEINNASIPNSLKNEQMWSAYEHKLTQLFSVNFAPAFKNYILEIRERIEDGFTLFAGTSSNAKANWLKETDGTQVLGTIKYDFWLLFAEALKAKVELFTTDEADIEELFGIVDTRKEIFSDGAKRGDDGNLLTRWNLEGVQWGKNTDKNGYIYLEMNEAGAVIELYKHSSKTSDYKVGVAVLNEISLKFIVSEFNDSGLTGELIVTELDESANIYISALPLVLSWRLNSLRKIWEEQDALNEVPIIDPDLINPSDIDFPYDIDTVSPSKAIDLWQQRKNQLDEKLEDIQEAREAANISATSYGTSGTGSSQLNNPWGIVKVGDVVYISDTDNDRIQKLESGTIGTTSITGIVDPKGIVANADGELIVVDNGNDTVKLFTAPTETAEEWSIGTTGTTLGTFTSPNGLLLTSDNELYVTDEAGEGRIQRFTFPTEMSSYTQTALLTINTTTKAISGVKQVTQVIPSMVSAGDTFKLTLAETGSVTYNVTSDSVADVVKGLVHAIGNASWSSVMVEDKGAFIEFTATANNTPFTLTYDQTVAFSSLKYIAADRQGNLFVTDAHNNRIIKLNREGVISKVYGNPHRLHDQLKLFLRLDELTGTSARDASGAGHNGTVNGTTSWSAESMEGQALNLNGTSNYLHVASHSDLDASNKSKRTLEIWFNASDKDKSAEQILYRQGDHQKGMCVYLKAGILHAGIYGTGFSDFLSTGSVLSQTWQHIVVVFSDAPADGKNKFRAFLNGVEFFTEGQGNTSTVLEADASPDGVTIGALKDGGYIKFKVGTIEDSATDDRFFEGVIDNVRIWNRALDDNEVSYLYNRLESEDATFFMPGAITTDLLGNLYVADQNRSRVVKLNNTGTFVRSYSGIYGTNDYELQSPIAIAVHGEDVFVADSVREDVQHFNNDGFVQVLDPDSAFTGIPYGVTTDSNGLVYVCDNSSGANGIVVFDKQGTQINKYTTFTEPGSANYDEPKAIASDSEGRLIVLNSGDDKLVRIQWDGTTDYVLKDGPWAELSMDASIAIGEEDSVYFVKADGLAIKRTAFPVEITEVVLPAGSSLSNTSLDNPKGITIDVYGNLWVADTDHHRVLKMNRQGVYLNDIGKTDNTSGTGIGEFNAPEYVTTDEAGNIYVSDTGNDRIQKFDNSGEHLATYTNSMFASIDAPTGLIITSERKLYVASAGSNDKIYLAESMHGLNAAIDEWNSGQTVDTLLSLAVKERQGIDITSLLTNLNLGYDSYRQLQKVIRMSESGIELTDEQWTILYNILVHSFKKRDFYTDWLNEEIELGIVLSPDHFRLQDDQTESFINLVNWRAFSRERKNWRQVLTDRIEQEQGIIKEYYDIIEKAEEQHLMSLRDALIDASNFPGNNTTEKARYGTEKLLVDLLNDCCRKTSRVAQAIETLQNFAWGIQNGLIRDKHPQFALSKTAQFDEEWQWMGSYATWRAAQFVFMYPENLLVPSYNNKQSYGFRKLIDDLRINSQITPESIRTYLRDYYNYLDDLKTLSIVESEQAATIVKKDNAGILNTNTTYKNYVHLIAKATRSGNLYWNIMDPSSTQMNVASTWKKLEMFEDPASLKVLKLETIGFEGGKRFLVLFCLDNKTGKSKIIHTRFDLEEGTWADEVTEVEIPDIKDSNNNVLRPANVFINTTNSFKNIKKNGGLYGSQPSGEIYVLLGAGEANRKMKACRFSSDLNSMEIIPNASSLTWASAINKLNYDTSAVAQFVNNMPVYFTTGNANVYMGLTLNYGGYNIAQIIDTQILPQDIQNPNSPNQTLYLFYTTLNDKFTNVHYLRFINNGTSLVRDVNSEDPNLEKGILTLPIGIPSFINFFINENNQFCVVYQVGNNIYTREFKTNVDKSISMTQVVNSVNLNFGQFTFPDPEYMNSGDYYTAIQSLIQAKPSVHPNNFLYIEELYYSVPMTIALLLQRRGLYEEALDWFRLVYDYSATADKKYVYSELNSSNSFVYMAEDFDNNRNLPVTYGPDPKKEVASIVPNPSREGNNVSYNCLSYKINPLANGYIQFELNRPDLIDLNNPDYRIKIKGSVSTAVYLKVMAKVNGVDIVHSTYKAFLTSNSWTELPISQKPASQIVSASPYIYAVRICIAESDKTKIGQVYYLDEFSFKTKSGVSRPDAWLSDPINPHAIAASRKGAHLRYTIMSLAACMIDYADSEYTKDTPESISRATLLYENAIDLLKSEGLAGTRDECLRMIQALQPSFSDEWTNVWKQIKDDLLKVKEFDTLKNVISDIQTTIDGGGTEAQKLRTIRNIVNVAIEDPGLFTKISDNLTSEGELNADLYMQLQSDPRVKQFLDTTAAAMANEYLLKVQELTKVKSEVLLSDTVFADGTVLAQLHNTSNAITNGVIRPEDITGSIDDIDSAFLEDLEYDPNNPEDRNALQQFLLKDLHRSLANVLDYKLSYMPSVKLNFCLPSNPIPDTLRFRAEINLYKIRNCRNIAGIVRELEAFAAPTDAVTGVPALNGGLDINVPANQSYVPTIYRYQVLIERAKQLVQIAQQIESSMLSTLEKLDAENYSLLKARQDLSLSKAGIRLQDLRIKEAKDGVKLAGLQRDRVDLQFEYYDGLISAGLLAGENAAILLLFSSSILSLQSAATSIAPGEIFGSLASMASTLSSIASMSASYERRRQEWNFQRDLASQDQEIADQQILIAEDQLAIIGQEREISLMQADNAEATIEFLRNKFTNAELYDWMSNILEQVYRYFLYQATATAKQAMVQLAFERQQNIPEYIQNDYWQAPIDNLLSSGVGENKTVDRKGITGSTRLLQDIFQLDQFAFDTDQRKLELSKTFSLATLAPTEFQRFKETGEIIFETPMKAFDRDFPGHYLRLIKRVKTSVIALVSPMEGIKASLSNKGLSTVVTEGANFQEVTLRRVPEYVALTASSNATGLFELNPIQDNKLLPFENSGVETVWAFNMPKASNFFDYDTIADVLITIEYTALFSEDYRSVVIRELDTKFQANRAFSFRNNFADQWYDLNNPDLTDSKMKVDFSIGTNDFPANLRDVRIKDITLFFSKSDDLDETKAEDQRIIEAINTLEVASLKYEVNGSNDPKIITKLAAFDSMISSRTARGATIGNLYASNGNSVATNPSDSVNGVWTIEFDLADQQLFTDGHITDILFVISYEGEASEW